MQVSVSERTRRGDNQGYMFDPRNGKQRPAKQRAASITRAS